MDATPQSYILNIFLSSKFFSDFSINFRIPSSAGDDDGILLRLLSSNDPGQNMYFVKILKNRRVVMGRSILDAGAEMTNNFQVDNTSSTIKWLEKEEYTGFWLVYNLG